MPDGDKVYGGDLGQAYEGPYEEICEGYHSPMAIAYDLLRPLQHDIKQFGIEPVQLVIEVAECLEELPQGPLLRGSIDWLSESREIERKAQSLKTGHRRAMDLAVRACKQHLRKFQDGSHMGPHLQVLLHSYLVSVYDAQFEQRVPLDYHHDGVDDAVFRERLHEVRPFVVETLRGWADTIIRTQRLSGLRRPSRLRPRIYADTNLLN